MTDESGAVEPGARIIHSELGAGRVRRLRRGGRALLVNFDSHPKLLLEVRAHEVRLESEAAAIETAAQEAAPLETKAPPASSPPPKAVQPHPSRGPFRRATDRSADAPQAMDAARSLEALRLGVVPHADLRASSVGRDREMALVSRDLTEAAERGSARVFLGDYGTGKTHLLELIESEALSRGFLVGRATLDAQYVRPSHPMRVYRAVVSTLRYPDAAGAMQSGLAPLFQRALDDERLADELASGESPLANHLYLSPTLHYYRELSTLDDPTPRELLVDWVSGHRPEGNVELDGALRKLGRRGPRIYALKDFQPWAHVYAYNLGGLAVLARRLGYKGLVVLLDEAENYDLLGSEGRSFADAVFRCLVMASLGPDRVRFEESAIKKGGFPPQKRLPLVFSPGQPLHLVAAMTPSTAGEQLLRGLLDPSRLVELSRLEVEDYHELSGRLATLYESAYPDMSLPDKLNQSLAEVLWALIQSEHIESPREATKLTVEFLDVLRLRPGDLQAFFADIAQSLKR